MKRKIIFYIIISLINSKKSSENDEELHLLIELFRHGARRETNHHNNLIKYAYNNFKLYSINIKSHNFFKKTIRKTSKNYIEEKNNLKNNIYPDKNSKPGELTPIGYKSQYFLGKAIEALIKILSQKNIILKILKYILQIQKEHCNQ